MRRSVLSAILAATLGLFACSEQPTEAPITAPPIPRGPASLVVCTAAGIQAQIDALFPAGGLLTSAQAQFSSIPKAVDKETGTAARDKTIAIVDFLLTTYYAGQLTGGLSTATFDQVLDLIRSFYCFASLASPDLPSTSGGSDVVVVLVSPGDPITTVVTPSEHAAVTIPEGAVPAPTLIAISLLEDDPPPLRTSLDQYPFFYHFSGTTATGPVTFNLDVTAGVCLRDNIDVPDANLRLAHNVAPFGFGDVEILPRPASVPGLNCTNLGESGPVGSAGSWGEGRFAWAKRLLLPAELHAASVALETAGVGGTTKKFSEFGVVDISSNPADLDYNPGEEAFSDLTAPPGTAVTPAPSVVVRSSNGTPIPNVPVEFAVGEEGGTVNGSSTATVATGDDGIATVTSWVLGTNPGTYTLSATPLAIDQVGTAEPYKPAAAFDPTSLTFQATVEAEVTITFSSPILLHCEGSPSVCNERFTQDGYVVQSFWVQGDPLSTIPGHFHPSETEDVFEAHHWQGENARQGVRISRVDGEPFTLKSIEYRSRAGNELGTPFEIGTSPVTSISGSPGLATGYTPFAAPVSSTFQTVLFSGFEEVNQAWITMRGAADWDNIVLAR